MAEYKLYCGDFMYFLDRLPRGCIAIFDPPYGIGENNRKNLSRGKLAKPIDYGYFGWDSERLPDRAIEKILQHTKHQVIFGGNYYANILPSSSGWIVWDKMNGASDFSDCELAWTSYNKAVRKISYMWNGMIKQKPEERYHPTQKPLKVMDWIVRNYTKQSDTIIDFTMGSGTTIVAAINNKRNAIGIEIDENMFNIAETRIRNANNEFVLTEKERATGQLPLFSV